MGCSGVHACGSSQLAALCNGCGRAPPEQAAPSPLSACRINLTIPWTNGTWREDIGGPRWPPRGEFSTAFMKVPPQCGWCWPSCGSAVCSMHRWHGLRPACVACLYGLPAACRWPATLLPPCLPLPAVPGGGERAAGLGQLRLTAARLQALQERDVDVHAGVSGCMGGMGAVAPA